MPHRAMLQPPADYLPLPLACAWGAACGAATMIFGQTMTVAQAAAANSPWWLPLAVAVVPPLIAVIANQVDQSRRVKELMAGVVETRQKMDKVYGEHVADVVRIAVLDRQVTELKALLEATKQTPATKLETRTDR